MILVVPLWCKKNRTQNCQGIFIRQNLPKQSNSVFHQTLGMLASWLEIIAQGVQSEGFSVQVARGILWGSSLQIYDRRWKRFAKYCKDWCINPWHVTFQQVAYFPVSFYQQANLKVRSTEGYCSVIKSTLKQTGTCISCPTQPFPA